MTEVQAKEKEAKELKETKETKEKKEEVPKTEELKEKIEVKKEEKTEKEEEKEIKKKEEKKEEKEVSEKEIKENKLSIIFKRKPLRILLLLLQNKKWYPSLLARESGQSYVHATKILNALEDIGLVSFDSTGKKKIITLTEKGEKLARAIEEVTKNL